MAHFCFAYFAGSRLHPQSPPGSSHLGPGGIHPCGLSFAGLLPQGLWFEAYSAQGPTPLLLQGLRFEALLLEALRRMKPLPKEERD